MLKRRLLLILLLLPGASCARPASTPQGDSQISQPEKLATRHLPNAMRIHEKVISGGLPDGDEAFAELRELGVKTIISVDGARPDVATAKKFGLRYVHLPHGYDGIPQEKAALLAKAVRELPGPIYIHCHHGHHRSPAAAAVACIGAGYVAPSQSAAILKLAGTSPHYRGLYAAAAESRALDPARLDALAADFPETVEPSPMAEAMVAMERTHDHLKKLEANGWQALASSPDLDAAHEALLMREHFAELLRTEEVSAQPAAFVELIHQGETGARELEAALQARGRGALAPVSRTCTECHQRFRDVPRQ